MAALGILDLCRGQSVLDIGCHTGFVSLSVCESAASVTGVDPNPCLIDIAKDCQAFLQIPNAYFLASRFERYPVSNTFDVVLSLSNHCSYDGYICGSVPSFFRKCRQHVDVGGTLIVESHTPLFERAFSGGERDLMRAINNHFDVVHFRRLSLDNPIDSGRYCIVAVAR
jgi:SAM-dependent methyltransferase